MEVKRMFVTLTSLMALSLGPVSAQAQAGTEKVNEKFHIYLLLLRKLFFRFSFFMYRTIIMPIRFT